MRYITEVQKESVRLWQRFYKETFAYELTEALIPEPEEAYDGKWLIIRVPEIGAQELFERCNDLFDAWAWTSKDLNAALDQTDSIRSGAQKPYGVWIEAGQEPEANTRGKSGNSLKYLGVTLEERLLLEMFYWWNTGGQHLDHQYRTLCSGSTFKDAGIPCVGWDMNNNRLHVDCCFLPEQGHNNLCVRKVIAAPEIPWVGVVLN